MTERLDNVRKLVNLFKGSAQNCDTKGAVQYGSAAISMMGLIGATTKKEEAKELEELENETESIFQGLSNCDCKRVTSY